MTASLTYSTATAVRPMFGGAGSRTAYRVGTGSSLERRPASTPLAFHREALAIAREVLESDRTPLAVQFTPSGVGVVYRDAYGRLYASLSADARLTAALGADGFRALADRLAAMLGVPAAAYPAGEGWGSAL